MTRLLSKESKYLAKNLRLQKYYGKAIRAKKYTIITTMKIVGAI